MKLDPLKANAEGQTLSVTGNNTIELKDVLVGEVWICSGQSNMEWACERLVERQRGSRRGQSSADPSVQRAGHLTAALPHDNCPGSWTSASRARSAASRPWAISLVGGCNRN